MKPYDALVIGAGPAGATAALVLARAGWSVALVEKASFPRRKVCGEFVSAASLPLLHELGVADAFLGRAGPGIRRIGLYSGKTKLSAGMPGPRSGAAVHGRALGREHLDTLLLAGAAQAGAEVWQPWTLRTLQRAGDGFSGMAVAHGTRDTMQIKARVVIAAHGSWEPGSLPTQAPRPPPRASDLFAFKAHFRNCKLPADLMPLLVFPGGYGGMVHSDDGRASLSLCIRRDSLEQARRKWCAKAPESAFGHVLASCLGVSEALSAATREGSWLGAGPIRPGMRMARNDGVFAVGNAAGEAHPIVAEGISMAMQSAWLLCEQLLAHQEALLSGREALEVARAYAASWHRNIARRIRVAALFAQIAMRPATAELALAILERAPNMLTLGARLSGKIQPPIGLQDAGRRR